MISRKQSISALMLTILLLSFCNLAACGSDGGGGGEGGGGSGAVSGPSTIPEFARWEAQMKSYGQKNCQRLSDMALSNDERLSATYYDAQWIFYRIADHTGDSFWKSCALKAQNVYRDQYVFANDGKVPGYWKFSHGLMESFLRSGDKRSKEAALLLSDVAPFSPDETPVTYTANADASREVAYTILAYLNAERLGQPRRARLATLVDQALTHLNQWFVNRQAPYVRPFMVALTAQALIAYNEVSPDQRILPALIRAADMLWDKMWLPAAEAFMYTDRKTESGGQEPAPDLNLLVAPLYGWLYKQTHQSKFRERGDQIFAGGVKFAYLENGKQFNQSYRWSFDYVKWRGR